MFVAVLSEMVLPLEETRLMPNLLRVAILLKIELSLEATDMPALVLAEFVATKPSRVQPSELRVIALPNPPACTIG